MEEDFQAELKLACEAVREAGQKVKDKFGGNTRRWQKAPGDFVSAVDLTSEKTIAQAIQRHWPEDGIMSEEDINYGREGERFWIIDPLDGTMNFLRRLPFFSLSLALYADGKVVVGVVYDPFHEELFSARRGEGAYLNGSKISTGTVKELVECCIATEYIGYLDSVKKRRMLGKLGENFGNIRMPGSQALGLAYTAAGRFDLSYLPRSNAWDMAAGSLLVAEAGGEVWAPGGYSCLKSGEITAGSSELVRKFVEEVLQDEYRS